MLNVTKTAISGALSPTEKKILISRIDDLIIKFEQAKAEANNIDVENIKFGGVLLNFIFEDIDTKAIDSYRIAESLGTQ